MNQELKVSSLSVAKKVKRRFEAVITIEDPQQRNGLRFHTIPHPDHLVLRFEDVDDQVADIALPDYRHLHAALRFARENGGKSLLVHCKVGIARSTAMMLAILADRHKDPDMAVARLLEIRPEAVPNKLLLEMADTHLGYCGALVRAWMRVEDSDESYAKFRAIKRQTVFRNPELYSRPLGGISSGILRYYPSSLVAEGHLVRTAI